MKNKIGIFLIVLVVLCGIQTAKADWVRQNTSSFAWFRDVFFVDQDRGWIVGTGGVMLTTENGGRTWAPARKFTTDAFLQIHFTNENTGWLLCERDVYARGNNPTSYLRKTIDGGRTWEKIEFLDSGRERVTKLLFNRDGTATAFGEGGIFYKLQDDGVTWKKSQTAIHFLLLDGSFADEFTGAIVGTAGTILFTEDSGLTWEKATLLGDRDSRLNAVYYSGPKGAWAVGAKGRVFRSTGGGRLWRQMDSGTTINLNDVFFTSASNGWAVGDEGVIIRTRDGGVTWSESQSHVTHRLEKVFFIGDRGWAVGYGGTLVAYDAGMTNSDQSSKPMLQKRN